MRTLNLSPQSIGCYLDVYSFQMLQAGSNVFVSAFALKFSLKSQIIRFFVYNSQMYERYSKLLLIINQPSRQNIICLLIYIRRVIEGKLAMDDKKLALSHWQAGIWMVGRGCRSNHWIQLELYTYLRIHKVYKFILSQHPLT